MLFNPEGGVCDVSEVQVPKGESVTLPEVTYEGYRFGGWIYGYESGPGTDTFVNVGYAGESFTPTVFFSDIHASWYKEFTLAFDACGGECAQGSMTVIKTDTVTLPEAVREGYEFTGWYGDAGLTEYAGTVGDAYSTGEDKTLYAGWKEEEKEKQKFTIIFNVPEGECDPSSVEVEEGESVTLPEATRGGYEFTGWYGDEGLTEYIGAAGDAYTPDGGKTLYAGWKEEKKEKQKFTILFNVPEGECDPRSVEVEEGDTVTLPEAMREGYEFIGWYGDENLTEYIGAAGDAYAPDGGKTLYAGWKEEEKEKQKFTIIFNVPEGECDPRSIEVEEGESFTLPEATREGYEFTGWYVDEGLTEYIGAAGDAYTPDEGRTLYADWKEEEKEKKKFTVIFDVAEGECDPKSVEVEEGDTVILPEATREGYEFTGWYGDEDLTEYIGAAGDAYAPDGGKTLYAGWKEEEKEKKKFTIIFDVAEGKCDPKSVEVEEGDTVTLPEATREGYEFTGWYGDEGLMEYIGIAGEAWMPDGGKTLYAGWKKTEENTGGEEKEPEQDKGQVVTVLFESGGGSKAAPVKAVKGSTIKLPSTEREGYVFLGWYTQKEGGILLGGSGDKFKVSEDMSLYALWEKKQEQPGDGKEDGSDKEQEGGRETCRAVFRTGKGSLTATEVTVAKGASLYLPLPVCEGYVFTGWYLDEALTKFAGAGGKAYRVTGDVCFYAGWKKSGENNKTDGAAETGKGETGKQEGEKAVSATGKPEKDKEGASRSVEAATGDKGTSRDGAGIPSAGNGGSQGESQEAADTGKVLEPVIQTGHLSPVPVFYCLGLCGLFLMASVLASGRKGSHGKR